MNTLQALLPTIEHFHTLGYWIAFFAALLETIIGLGLIIPGSTIVLFMGTLAARGYFDLGDLLWFAIAGAVIGDNINYCIGKRFGRKMLKKGLWLIKPEHLDKGEVFVKHYGSKSLFLARFVPGLKETASLIAGILHMKRLKFIVWDLLGAIGWGLLWILPGYFLYQSLGLAEKWVTHAEMTLFIFLVLFILLYLLYRYFKKTKIKD